MYMENKTPDTLLKNHEKSFPKLFKTCPIPHQRLNFHQNLDWPNALICAFSPEEVGHGHITVHVIKSSERQSHMKPFSHRVAA